VPEGGEYFYPSCVVNFRLRFDEAFKVDEPIPEPGPQDGDPAATSRSQQPVVGGKQVRGITHGRRVVKVPRPLITQQGDSNMSFISNRVPISAQVELPGYRQAGKFSLELDWRELPIDPRLVRSAAVEVYMGTVSPENFSAGMAGVEQDGSRRSVLKTTSAGMRGTPRDDLMVIAGVVDTWFVSHGETSSTVKIEGRDFRGIFLDSPVKPEVIAKINLDQPIDKVVAAILETHPQAARMEVKVSPEDWPNGAPATVLDSEGLTRVRRKANGEGTSAGNGGDDKVAMWDMITKYCFLVGAIPYFRGRTLVIRPAFSIFDQSKPTFAPTDPVFVPTPRTDDLGREFAKRKMIYGRNIRELTFERKLSGTKVPVIKVVSFDTSSTSRGLSKLLTAQWPPVNEKMARMSGVSPSGEVSQEDVKVISVHGIRDQNQLVGIARSLWEEISRQEIGGSCRTDTLASYKGDNVDPDLLRLRPGDAVDFRVDVRALGSTAPNVSTYVDSNRSSFAEAVGEIRQALWGKADAGDENLARVLAASSRGTVIDLLSTFRTSNVVFNWSQSAGIQVSFDFQNFVTVRNDISEQLGANATVATTTIGASNDQKPKTLTARDMQKKYGTDKEPTDKEAAVYWSRRKEIEKARRSTEETLAAINKNFRGE